MKRLNSYVWQQGEWPRFHWEAGRLLAGLGEARRRQGAFLGQLASLGLGHSRESRAQVFCEETLQSAAIEGEKLNPQAVRSSVARRLGLPSAETGVDRGVDGMVQVLWDASEHFSKPLTEKRLCGWQAALFPTGYSGLHKIRVGRWRGEAPMRVVSGPVGRETIHFEAPPAARLPGEMRRFLSWWGKESRSLDGLLRAGLAHLYFVTLHPFEDGNGRLARALTDMALAQDEKLSTRFYSLSTRLMARRSDYYDALERAQKGTLDVTDWLEWFLNTFIAALDSSRGTVERVLFKSRFWQNNAGLDISARQRKVLNRLLDDPEVFQKGVTTRHYVGMTRASRATAYREIADLVEKGVLKHHSGQGRNVRYALRGLEAPPQKVD